VVLKAVHRLKLEWVHVKRVPIPDSTGEVVVSVSCAVALRLWIRDVCPLVLDCKKTGATVQKHPYQPVYYEFCTSLISDCDNDTVAVGCIDCINRVTMDRL